MRRVNHVGQFLCFAEARRWPSVSGGWWVIAFLVFAAGGGGMPLTAVRAAEATFTGGDGSGELWNTATNWSTDAVPAVDGVAVFSAATDSDVIRVAGNSVGGLLVTRSQATAIEGVGQTNFTTNASGITVQAGAGPFTYGSSETATQVRQLMTVSQTWTNDSDAPFTVAAAGAAVRLSDGAVLTLGGSGDFVFNKGMTQQGSPNASVVWQGTGRVDLNLSSAGILGGFTLRSGTVRLGQNNALGGANGTGPVAAGSVVLESTSSRTINNAFTLTGDLTLGGVANLTISGSSAFDLGGATRTITVDGATLAIQGSVVDGGIVKAGQGTLALAGTNAYAGTTTVSAGVLSLASTAALPGWDAVGRYAVQSGATLSVGNAVSDPQIGTMLGTGNFQEGSILGIDVREIDRTLSIGVPAGIGLTKTGTGTLFLTGNNTPNATTIVAGTLEVGDGGTSGSLSGNVANGRRLAFNRSDDVVFGGTISGIGAVIKNGGGTLTLTADNTYTGATTVEAGTLLINGVHSGGGAVTVASGATLGGIGTIGGATTIGDGGTLAPGQSPGTLTFTQNVTFASDGNYNWEITSATGGAGLITGWDLVDIGGVLDIAATAEAPFKINLWSLSSTAPDVNGPAANFSAGQNSSWTIASAAGGVTGFSAEKFLINVSATNGTGGFVNDLAGGTFSVAQVGNDLNLVFTSATGPTDIVINVPTGQTQTQGQAGYPVLSGDTPVQKTGEGTLVLDAANTLSSNLAVNGGTAVAANTQALGTATLDVAAGATLAISPAIGAANAVQVADLGTIAGRIDVGTGRFTLPASAESPGGELRSLLVAGRSGGTWDGASGILSSDAPSSDGKSGFAVGYRVAGDNSATVAWASLGDADLDGAVTTADVNAILTSGLLNTGTPGATWQQGDFDYDGLVTTADINALLTTGRLNSGSYLPTTPPAGALTAVPEPGSLVLLAIGGAVARAAGFRIRRRRLTSPTSG